MWHGMESQISFRSLIFFGIGVTGRDSDKLEGFLIVICLSLDIVEVSGTGMRCSDTAFLWAFSIFGKTD